MVAMDFRRIASEGPIEIDSDIKAGLTSEECQRLNRVKSSLHKYSRFKDRLPQDEMDEKIQEEERRSQVRHHTSLLTRKKMINDEYVTIPFPYGTFQG